MPFIANAHTAPKGNCQRPAMLKTSFGQELEKGTIPIATKGRLRRNREQTSASHGVHTRRHENVSSKMKTKYSKPSSSARLHWFFRSPHRASVVERTVSYEHVYSSGHVC